MAQSQKKKKSTEPEEKKSTEPEEKRAKSQRKKEHITEKAAKEKPG